MTDFDLRQQHKVRVLAHQQIARLFDCSLEELFTVYQEAEPEDDDTTWMRMVYAIGQWRFGAGAWSVRHTEYFKERARQNALAGHPTPGRGGGAAKREMGQKLSLADLGL